MRRGRVLQRAARVARGDRARVAGVLEISVRRGPSIQLKVLSWPRRAPRRSGGPRTPSRTRACPARRAAIAGLQGGRRERKQRLATRCAAGERERERRARSRTRSARRPRRRTRCGRIFVIIELSERRARTGRPRAQDAAGARAVADAARRF